MKRLHVIINVFIQIDGLNFFSGTISVRRRMLDAIKYVTQKDGNFIIEFYYIRIL